MSKEIDSVSMYRLNLTENVTVATFIIGLLSMFITLLVCVPGHPLGLLGLIPLFFLTASSIFVAVQVSKVNSKVDPYGDIGK